MMPQLRTKETEKQGLDGEERKRTPRRDGRTDEARERRMLQE